MNDGISVKFTMLKTAKQRDFPVLKLKNKKATDSIKDLIKKYRSIKGKRCGFVCLLMQCIFLSR